MACKKCGDDGRIRGPVSDLLARPDLQRDVRVHVPAPATGDGPSSGDVVLFTMTGCGHCHAIGDHVAALKTARWATVDGLDPRLRFRVKHVNLDDDGQMREQLAGGMSRAARQADVDRRPPEGFPGAAAISPDGLILKVFLGPQAIRQGIHPVAV
jgi:hypothetical protein